MKMNPFSLVVMIIIKLNFCICHIKDGTSPLHFQTLARIFLIKTEFSDIPQFRVLKVVKDFLIRHSLKALAGERKFDIFYWII